MKYLPSAVLALVMCASAPAADEVATPLPKINTAPGAEYSDAVRMFQGIPTIERASNGRLWAAWYGGGVTEDHHNYVMLATSGDDGKSWTMKLVLDPDGDGPVRAFDPCLWHDPNGRLWLTWAQRGGNTSVSLLAITTSNPGDENPGWTEPRVIAPGIMMDKPLFTSSGWLLPVAVWHRPGSSMVFRSTDDGQTFQKIGSATIPREEDRNCDEHMLVQRRDGSLLMWVRTKYGIGESTSTDGGKTWSDVAPSSVAHTTSRFFIRRLKSGNLLLIKHGNLDERGARKDLRAFISTDDGKTWRGGLLIDDRKNVSYPDAVESADGVIYMIYDLERTGDKQILMATFTEADAAAGKAVSSSIRSRTLINQAMGINPGKKASAAKPN